MPVGSRGVGGPSGGANEQVYQLGRAGWKLLNRTSAYWAARTVNAHTLMIGDVLVGLRGAEHDRGLRLLWFDPEPACYRAVGTVELTPDAYAEIGLAEHHLRYALWLEIDTGSEHSPVIRDKCIRYWQAYQQ